MRKTLVIFSLVAACGLTLKAQTNTVQLQKVIALKSAGKCKDALPIIQALLQQDSNNVKYLAYTSSILAKVWHDKELDEKECTPYYNQALYLAQKALKKDSNEAEAQFAFAFAIGVLNEYASHKQQISNSKIMKDALDKCLKLDPHHGGAYHLLGRWYDKLAGFNGFEKFMVKTLFGSSLPDVTYQDAVNAYIKAIKEEPDNLIHMYEMGNTYYEMDKYSDAKAWLNVAINNTTYQGDDTEQVKDKCKKLLAKMN